MAKRVHRKGHRRRGHWRHYDNGAVWVEPTWVSDHYVTYGMLRRVGR